MGMLGYDELMSLIKGKKVQFDNGQIRLDTRLH